MTKSCYEFSHTFKILIGQGSYFITGYFASSFSVLLHLLGFFQVNLSLLCKQQTDILIPFLFGTAIPMIILRVVANETPSFMFCLIRPAIFKATIDSIANSVWESSRTGQAWMVLFPSFVGGYNFHDCVEHGTKFWNAQLYFLMSYACHRQLPLQITGRGVYR